MHALIPALGRLRQEDLYEFEASLVYSAYLRKVRATQGNPISKNKTKEPQNKTKQKTKRKKERKGNEKKCLFCGARD